MQVFTQAPNNSMQCHQQSHTNQETSKHTNKQSKNTVHSQCATTTHACFHRQPYANTNSCVTENSGQMSSPPSYPTTTSAPRRADARPVGDGGGSFSPLSLFGFRSPIQHPLSRSVHNVNSELHPYRWFLYVSTSAFQRPRGVRACPKF